MTPPEATLPQGPWVLVIGCHRSGTSAVTGALVALGLQGVDPGDRIEHSASNPEHWESLAAGLYDEDLLIELGGAWDAPPPAAAEPLTPTPKADRPEPAEILTAAYPLPGPLVWKDPRACLLLPYWRSVLPGPLAAVLVWREPLAVARSLYTRDRIPLADGLALWERYNRSAVAGLQGVDTYILDYASVLDDPGAALGKVAAWLGGLDQFARSVASWDVDRAATAVDRGLRHETAEVDKGAPDLPAEQLPLAEWLTVNAGPHAPLEEQAPAAVTPWPEAVLADRRAIADVRREMTEVKGTMEALVHSREIRLAIVRSELQVAHSELEAVRSELDRTLASTSWKVTGPLRSVMARAQRKP